MYTFDALTREFIFLEAAESPTLADFEQDLTHVLERTNPTLLQESAIEGIFIPDDEFGHELQVSPIFWCDQLLRQQDKPVVLEINADRRDTSVIRQEIMSAIKIGAFAISLYTARAETLEVLLDVCTAMKEFATNQLPVVPIGIHSPVLLDPSAYVPTEFLIAGADYVIIPEHYAPEVIIPVVQEFDYLGLIPLVKMGIFHEPSIALWGAKHLDMGITLDVYDRLATAENPLKEGVYFALNYMNMLYDFGGRGAILTLPVNEKTRQIKERLYPRIRRFLQQKAASGELSERNAKFG